MNKPSKRNIAEKNANNKLRDVYNTCPAIIILNYTICFSLYLGYAQIYWFYKGTLNLLFLARFRKSFYLINMKFRHNIPRVA